MKTYKVPMNGLNFADWLEKVNKIPMAFNDESNKSIAAANELVTIDGEFLTDEFELVDSVL